MTYKQRGVCSECFFGEGLGWVRWVTIRHITKQHFHEVVLDSRSGLPDLDNQMLDDVGDALLSDQGRGIVLHDQLDDTR